MPGPRLDIAVTRYENTRALFDGTVTFDGIDAALHSPPIPDIFTGVAAGRFDVAELGLTHYLRALDVGTDLVALPVFPARTFRHSSVFVNTTKGITGPADLVGRTIGEYGMYGQDAGIWIKGILAEDFGFAVSSNRWVVGGLDSPLPAGFEFTTHIQPPDVEVGFAPADRTLGDMLDRGEIDALFTSNAPAAYLAGSPDIAPLFTDHEGREREWHRRTGIFPIMHTVVARRALLEDDPDLARRLYDGFLRAKDVAAQRYRDMRRLFQVTTMVPWMHSLFERNRTEFDDDWFAYGLRANRTTLETFLRYSADQGLSPAHRTVDDLFTTPQRTG